MSSNIKWVILLALVCCAGRVRAETRIFFDQPEYVVSAVGATFDVQILIDANDRTPELEPIRGGLFSFGTELTFDSGKAEVSGLPAVQIPSELDYFGFLGGAYVEVDAGRVGAKGNINQNSNPLAPYVGQRLMTVTLTNQASPVDVYPLQLDFFRTLGDSEQLFLNGTGTVLDGSIVFGDAVVRVVPEPASAMPLLIGLVPWLVSSRRFRNRLATARQTNQGVRRQSGMCSLRVTMEVALSAPQAIGAGRNSLGATIGV